MDDQEDENTLLQHMNGLNGINEKENIMQNVLENCPHKMLKMPDDSKVMMDNSTLKHMEEQDKENLDSISDVILSEDNIAAALHKDCEIKYLKQCTQYEEQLDQIKLSSLQKDNTITLLKRENSILEKEKAAYRKEKELAIKEKEAVVIKFANKEKLLLDAKKEKETIEKQLKDAHKEIKNCTIRFQALNEEKSRITNTLDEKCNELRKQQRECEKLKTEINHLESKLKYNINKLNAETESKLVLERKLEDERNAPSKLEEKAYDKLKIEFEAQAILLKHATAHKNEQLDILTKDNEQLKGRIKRLEEQLNEEVVKKCTLSESLKRLQEEHNTLQNSYSEEMLNSAKLCGQLEELQVLKTQNALYHEQVFSLSEKLKEALQKLEDMEYDLQKTNDSRDELLSINKEISETIVGLQNEICLLKGQVQGITAENDFLLKEKAQFNDRFDILEKKLKAEQNQKNEDRLLLAKHLSEKTKLYEVVKHKLDNVLGDFEATKHKHAISIKELQREIIKYKKLIEQNENHNQNYNEKSFYCMKCHQNYNYSQTSENELGLLTESKSQSILDERKPVNNVKTSESSDSDTVISTRIQEVNFRGRTKEPSRKNLVERILRLQQASARQAEKIDFLESHISSLITELQKKSKVIQYYMLRDQTGALTSNKSDQNKNELAKYGNGVMSAIYNGIKGTENNSMTLELSLEINKKLQAVLEDTLLKNITLKENLDVLGLEVDDLTRKLRQIEIKET